MKTTGRSMFMTLGIGAASLMLGGCPSKEAEYVDEPPPATNTAPPPTIATSGPCDQYNLAQAMSILGERTKTEMAGYEPEGSILCGNVPQGGTVDSQWFQLQPGMCYAILAQGMPGVTEVDVSLIVDPTAAVGMQPGQVPMAATPILVDNSGGNSAYAGPCGKWAFGPFVMPAKVQIKARAGQGAVAAQLYRKPG